MRLSIIKTVFKKELREMLRDRRSLAVMFGVPLILYPLLTFGLATLGNAKVKDLKETRYKIVLLNPKAAPALTSRLIADDSGLQLFETQAPSAKLSAGQIDAIVTFPDALEADALAGKPVAVDIQLDRSRTEADFVERKLSRILSDYEQYIIAQRLSAIHAPPAITRGVDRNVHDVATAGQRMGNRLAQILPLLVLITGMLGALFPALSATTTERELGTLETLLVTPAGRMELLLAKGALVLICGLLTAALNLLSMSLVLWRTFSLVAPGENLSISFLSIVYTFFAATPALIFFTVLVLIVGLLARTFREANSYATPVMLLPLASLALSIADVKATPGLLITPIANTTLVMRDVLRDRGSFGAFAIAFASSLVYAGLLMSVAARLFSNEQLVNPGWEPLSLKGLGKSRRPRLPDIDEAIALCALSVLLLFYVQPSLTSLGLYATLAITQVLLVFAPAAIWSWWANWQWPQTFKLHRTTPKLLIAGALMGIGLAPVIDILGKLQSLFWPADPAIQKAMNDLLLPSIQAHPFFTSIFLGALAGIFEELLFRGPIQTALIRRCRPIVAITITATLFAAAHFDLHGLAIRAILGFILGWTVWRTHSIFPAMLLHGSYDATTILMAAWDMKRFGPETTPPMFDAVSTTRLAIGLAFTLIGWRLIQQAKPPQNEPDSKPAFSPTTPAGAAAPLQ